MDDNVSTHFLAVDNFKVCVSYPFSRVCFSPSVAKSDAVVFDVGEDAFVTSKMH